MANMLIDKNRYSDLCISNPLLPAADKLFRDKSVFFVGGNLPVYETLETMFDSFCMEATNLFYLVFGPGETFLQGEEMAHQIKKNFHARLMARLDVAVGETALERIYAAGVDNVDFHLAGFSSTAALPRALQSSVKVFPRWGVAVTLPFADTSPDMTKKCIDRLLHEGIVPLPQLSFRSDGFLVGDDESVLTHLVAGWERSSVNLSAYLPLLAVTTPLAAARPAGLFRGFFDKLRHRHQLAESDIRRHLRVQPAADSLDSAGL
jgi:hypothetical protein